jgi:hypothetical protein
MEVCHPQWPGNKGNTFLWHHRQKPTHKQQRLLFLYVSCIFKLLNAVELCWEGYQDPGSLPLINPEG